MKYLSLLKKFFFTLLGIFIFTEFLFLISPKIIDANSHKKEISKLSKKIIDTEFTFDELTFKTYPDFSIKIDAKNANLENLAKINDLSLKIGLQKLIFGKISVKHLKLNNSSLNIIFFNDGSTNIDKILLPMPFKVDLKNSEHKINNFKLLLNDKKTGQKINIEGDYITAKINRKDIVASIKGEIQSQNENAKIDLQIEAPLPDIKTKFKNKSKYLIATGYIKNLHPEIFEEFIKTYISKDLQDIEGVINAQFNSDYEENKSKNIDVNIDIDNLKILSKKKENSVIFEGKNNIKSKIVIDKKDLKINDFVFSSDDYNISANGVIEKFKTQKPKINFDINIDNSKIEKFYWMLPSNLFTANEEIRKIKRYGAYGIANGNIQLKGNILKPEVYGKINFKDVWILDGLPNNIPKAVVNTNFKKDIVQTDVKVWATEKEYVTVVGYSDFYDLSNNEYQINSTDNVPLAVAQKLLPPVSDVLGFVIGPVPIMDIKGLGNIDLNAKGSQKNPTLKGYFNFKNASASFNDIKVLKLENASGRIDFKKDKVYFKNDTGTILGRKAIISGVSDIKIDIDYEAKVDNLSLGELLKTLKESPMLKDYSKQVEMISRINGTGDVLLNLKGHIDDPKTVANPDVVKYIVPKGTIKIKNAIINSDSPKITLNNTNGIINIDNNKTDLDINTNLFTSPIKINGKIIDNKADLNILSDKMKLIDSAKFLSEFYLGKNTNFNDISKTTLFSMNMNYKGNVDKIDLSKVNLSAIFQNNKNSISNIDILSGTFFFKNGNLSFNNLNTKFYNTTTHLNGNIDNAFKKPLVNMDMTLYKFDLSTLNSLKKSSIIPEKYKKILNAYKDYKGIISSNLHIKNNNINGSIWMRNITFSHAILDYPFLINSADFNFKNGGLEINSFNASFARTPVFIKGTIDNLIKNPKFNVNFSSKLSKDFVDNYINTNLSYPINVKGEILLSSQITGTKNSVNIIPSIKLEQDADISYMGANLGDENSVREIKADIQKTKNKLLIKNLDYSKYIYSQNNMLYPLLMLNIKTSVSYIKDKIFFDYLKIKTSNPINANIFNAILKKSLVKGGNFTCDLDIDGYINNPRIKGDASLKNIDIPLYETHVDDVKVNINRNHINLNAKINYLDSDMNITAKIKNNGFKKVFVDEVNIYSQKTDLNKLLKVLNEISYKNPIQIVGQSVKQNDTTEQIPVDLKNIIIEKGSIKADNIFYKSLPISNFSSKLSFKNNNFKIEKTTVDIADGKLRGDFGYNLEKALISVNAETKGVDANKIAKAMLDIKNQIYGSLDGSINITTFGADDMDRMKNLNGELLFSVNDGKMPKLGSIEYLLRAGNLLKSGISGLTLNNIAGLLLPVQQGDFETIKGDLKIKNGIIDDLKIYSKGKNLSILITGNYELETSKTDLYILGKLSKNINTILGPVGNASLNSFFNLIPGVHLDELKDTEMIKQINSIPELSLPTDKFRIFRAKVDGDISSDSFVSKFEWVNK